MHGLAAQGRHSQSLGYELHVDFCSRTSRVTSTDKSQQSLEAVMPKLFWVNSHAWDTGRSALALGMVYDDAVGQKVHPSAYFCPL